MDFSAMYYFKKIFFYLRVLKFLSRKLSFAQSVAKNQNSVKKCFWSELIRFNLRCGKFGLQLPNSFRVACLIIREVR